MSRGFRSVGVRADVEAAGATAGMVAPGWRSATWGKRMIWGALLIAGLLVSRLPLAPHSLITFDDVNFALAIEHFNPAAHQPQPPGYPLFVGLTKLLALVIPNVETVLLAAALLLSIASLLLIWTLGDRMLGRPRGMTAAVLLLCNPPFWFASLTNPVRLSLSLGATAVALCLFTALQRQSSHWFIAGTAVSGLAAGFRPTLTVLLAPLVVWTAIRLRVRSRVLVTALFAFGLAILTWLPFLLAASGGLLPFIRLLRGYSYTASHETSLITGAPLGAALHMAAQAVVWSCLGVLSWIWLVPWAARRKGGIFATTLVPRFLVLWFLPGLIFYATYHVADPDHTLSIVPVTCLAGAAVLESFNRVRSLRVSAAIVCIALALNVFLFLKPISKIAKASTYTAAASLDRYIQGFLQGAGRVSDPDGVTIVFPPGSSAWRNVSYYFPGARVIVAGDEPQDVVSVLHIHSKRGETLRGDRTSIRVPSCGVIAVADPAAIPVDAGGVPVATSTGAFFSYFPAAPGISFRSHGVGFVAENEPCPSTAAAPLGTTAAAPARANSSEVRRSIPHFAAGNQFVTGFYVINTSPMPAYFSIGFYGDNGKPVAVPLRGLGRASTVSDTVPAYGSKYFEAGDPESTLSVGGSVIIHSDPSIEIQALFRRRASADTFYEAAVPSTAGGTEVTMPFDQTVFAPTGNPISTAVAIANLDSAQSASVVCTARNRLGSVIQNAVPVPVLSPLGHWSGFNFPALVGWRGTLICTANVKIGAVALRVLANGTISSLPVVTK